MKKPLIVANWKLYVQDAEDALQRARAITRGAKKVSAQLVICPPAPFIGILERTLSRAGVSLGAQHVSPDGAPARTGEMPAEALASTGATYVIVGHSERRAMGQSEADIRAALSASLEAKLHPILCIGEHERNRTSGDHFSVIDAQLRAVLEGVTPRDAKRLVVAYEPVWAIGKSAADAMAPSELEETAMYIRKVLVELFGRAPALSIPVLYGGSVEPANAASLVESGVSGFLVGHASVEPQSLLAIARAAAK